jgi:hypothetical protein
MPTECNPALFDFPAVEGRQVVACFDGGAITSDAGTLLLGQTDRAIRLTERFAACFSDTRTPELVEHQVETMVMQRVVGIARPQPAHTNRGSRTLTSPNGGGNPVRPPVFHMAPPTARTAVRQNGSPAAASRGSRLARRRPPAELAPAAASPRPVSDQLGDIDKTIGPDELHDVDANGLTVVPSSNQPQNPPHPRSPSRQHTQSIVPLMSLSPNLWTVSTADLPGLDKYVENLA